MEFPAGEAGLRPPPQGNQSNETECSMPGDLDNTTIARAYARWAPVYDMVFGPVFEHGRTAAVAAAARVGRHILEVGVGTGISLPQYGEEQCVIGVDLSEPMLRRARGRVT